MLEEAYRTIGINDGEGQIKVPMAQAIVRSLAVNAVKGNQRAQRLFTELLCHNRAGEQGLNDEWLDVAITYKVEWDKELERRKRLGINDLPDPLPHPDHIVLDMMSGTAFVRGPSTREEKKLWDLIQGRRQEFEDELRDLEKSRDDPAYPHRAIVLQDIDTQEEPGHHLCSREAVAIGMDAPAHLRMSALGQSGHSPLWRIALVGHWPLIPVLTKIGLHCDPSDCKLCWGKMEPDAS